MRVDENEQHAEDSARYVEIAGRQMEQVKLGKERTCFTRGAAQPDSRARLFINLC
jgi:hypothetical protein